MKQDSKLFPDFTGIPGWFDWTKVAVQKNCPGSAGEGSPIWMVNTTTELQKEQLHGPISFILKLKDLYLFNFCPMYSKYCFSAKKVMFIMLFSCLKFLKEVSDKKYILCTF